MDIITLHLCTFYNIKDKQLVTIFDMMLFLLITIVSLVVSL